MTAVADDATVVWLAPGPPQADAARALAEWGRARGVRLTPAGAEDEAPTASLHVDLSVGERVDKELDRAREAIAALDADTAERALARAEALLREHPELPHAPWVRAEVQRTWASRWLRVDPKDPAKAQAAWQDADALDGGRVAGIGELVGPKRAPTRVALRVGGAPARAVVRVDGNEVARSANLSLAPGDHQVIVANGNAPIFASWISVPAVSEAPGAPPTTIDVRLGDDRGCGRSAFARASLDHERVHAAGVRCEHWVAAAPGPRPDAIYVARCERETCGPLLEWRVESSARGTESQVSSSGGTTHWPAWATWTLVGVGAAAATALTLVATGAFDSHPVEPRFVTGGVKIESR
ncbi:hypothetical protein AKJ09_07718 [Labilithrix luteola]|uniref:PEGA domain-containing protein n=1 Tax=Labilithrix luteola TaxID=1391654 RepID=A0A0K1Q6L6_9BACT|nr:hypothetical protein [Labilithrix luteola]AKV01055.1 hypothetical protein AKJ09_07718 [Labilithrix luteola]